MAKELQAIATYHDCNNISDSLNCINTYAAINGVLDSSDNKNFYLSSVPSHSYLCDEDKEIYQLVKWSDLCKAKAYIFADTTSVSEAGGKILLTFYAAELKNLSTTEDIIDFSVFDKTQHEADGIVQSYGEITPIQYQGHQAYQIEVNINSNTQPDVREFTFSFTYKDATATTEAIQQNPNIIDGVWKYVFVSFSDTEQIVSPNFPNTGGTYATNDYRFSPKVTYKYCSGETSSATGEITWDESSYRTVTTLTSAKGVGAETVGNCNPVTWIFTNAGSETKSAQFDVTFAIAENPSTKIAVGFSETVTCTINGVQDAKSIVTSWTENIFDSWVYPEVYNEISGTYDGTIGNTNTEEYRGVATLKYHTRTVNKWTDGSITYGEDSDTIEVNADSYSTEPSSIDMSQVSPNANVQISVICDSDIEFANEYEQGSYTATIYKQSVSGYNYTLYAPTYGATVVFKYEGEILKSVVIDESSKVGALYSATYNMEVSAGEEYNAITATISGGEGIGTTYETPVVTITPTDDWQISANTQATYTVNATEAYTTVSWEPTAYTIIKNQSATATTSTVNGEEEINTISVDTGGTETSPNDKVEYTVADDEYNFTASQNNQENHTITFSATGHNGTGEESITVYFDDRRTEEIKYEFDQWNNVTNTIADAVSPSYADIVDVVDKDKTHDNVAFTYHSVTITTYMNGRPTSTTKGGAQQSNEVDFTYAPSSWTVTENTDTEMRDYTSECTVNVNSDFSEGKTWITGSEPTSTSYTVTLPQQGVDTCEVVFYKANGMGDDNVTTLTQVINIGSILEFPELIGEQSIGFKGWYNENGRRIDDNGDYRPISNMVVFAQGDVLTWSDNTTNDKMYDETLPVDGGPVSVSIKSYSYNGLAIQPCSGVIMGDETLKASSTVTTSRMAKSSLATKPSIGGGITTDKEILEKGDNIALAPAVSNSKQFGTFTGTTSVDATLAVTFDDAYINTDSALTTSHTFQFICDTNSEVLNLTVEQEHCGVYTYAMCEDKPKLSTATVTAMMNGQTVPVTSSSTGNTAILQIPEYYEVANQIYHAPESVEGYFKPQFDKVSTTLNDGITQEVKLTEENYYNFEVDVTSFNQTAQLQRASAQIYGSLTTDPVPQKIDFANETEYNVSPSEITFIGAYDSESNNVIENIDVTFKTTGPTGITACVQLDKPNFNEGKDFELRFQTLERTLACTVHPMQVFTLYAEGADDSIKITNIRGTDPVLSPYALEVEGQQKKGYKAEYFVEYNPTSTSPTRYFKVTDGYPNIDPEYTFIVQSTDEDNDSWQLPQTSFTVNVTSEKQVSVTSWVDENGNELTNNQITIRGGEGVLNPSATIHLKNESSTTPVNYQWIDSPNTAITSADISLNQSTLTTSLTFETSSYDVNGQLIFQQDEPSGQGKKGYIAVIPVSYLSFTGFFAGATESLKLIDVVNSNGVSYNVDEANITYGSYLNGTKIIVSIPESEVTEKQIFDNFPLKPRKVIYFVVKDGVQDDYNTYDLSVSPKEWALGDDITTSITVTNTGTEHLHGWLFQRNDAQTGFDETKSRVIVEPYSIIGQGVLWKMHNSVLSDTLTNSIQPTVNVEMPEWVAASTSSITSSSVSVTFTSSTPSNVGKMTFTQTYDNEQVNQEEVIIAPQILTYTYTLIATGVTNSLVVRASGDDGIVYDVVKTWNDSTCTCTVTVVSPTPPESINFRVSNGLPNDEIEYVLNVEPEEWYLNDSEDLYVSVTSNSITTTYDWVQTIYTVNAGTTGHTVMSHSTVSEPVDYSVKAYPEKIVQDWRDINHFTSSDLDASGQIVYQQDKSLYEGYIDVIAGNKFNFVGDYVLVTYKWPTTTEWGGEQSVNADVDTMTYVEEPKLDSRLPAIGIGKSPTSKNSIPWVIWAGDTTHLSSDGEYYYEQVLYDFKKFQEEYCNNPSSERATINALKHDGEDDMTLTISSYANIFSTDDAASLLQTLYSCKMDVVIYKNGTYELDSDYVFQFYGSNIITSQTRDNITCYALYSNNYQNTNVVKQDYAFVGDTVFNLSKGTFEMTRPLSKPDNEQLGFWCGDIQMPKRTHMSIGVESLDVNASVDAGMNTGLNNIAYYTVQFGHDEYYAHSNWQIVYKGEEMTATVPLGAQVLHVGEKISVPSSLNVDNAPVYYCASLDFTIINTEEASIEGGSSAQLYIKPILYTYVKQNQADVLAHPQILWNGYSNHFTITKLFYDTKTQYFSIPGYVLLGADGHMSNDADKQSPSQLNEYNMVKIRSVEDGQAIDCTLQVKDGLVLDDMLTVHGSYTYVDVSAQANAKDGWDIYLSGITGENSSSKDYAHVYHLGKYDFRLDKDYRSYTSYNQYIIDGMKENYDRNATMKYDVISTNGTGVNVEWAIDGQKEFGYVEGTGNPGVTVDNQNGKLVISHARVSLIKGLLGGFVTFNIKQNISNNIIKVTFNLPEK